MEYIYAALLLDAAGKEITEKNLMEVIKSAGMNPDEAMAKSVASSLKGVDIKDVIKNAQNIQVAQPVAAQPSAGAAEKKKEEKAEEKVSEEEAAGGLASLFG
jgi:large subunit ribosomal protein L12